MALMLSTFSLFFRYRVNRDRFVSFRATIRELVPAEHKVSRIITAAAMALIVGYIFVPYQGLQ